MHPVKRKRLEELLQAHRLCWWMQGIGMAMNLVVGLDAMLDVPPSPLFPLNLCVAVWCGHGFQRIDRDIIRVRKELKGES